MLFRSSGPTNTYKPTVKPTQCPSNVPSREPTVSPSVHPTITPTVRPSAVPTATPSALPSVTLTVKPTRSPSARSTRLPSPHPTSKPTTVKTEAIAVSNGDEGNSSYDDRAYAIVGYSVLGLFGIWLLYYLRRWCSYELKGVQSDANRALYAASMDAKPKPRFPIFSFFVNLFITVKGVEVDFVPVENERTIVPSTVESSAAINAYSGVGAYMDGPAQFRDLEAYTPHSENVKVDVDMVRDDIELEESRIHPTGKIAVVAADVRDNSQAKTIPVSKREIASEEICEASNATRSSHTLLDGYVDKKNVIFLSQKSTHRSEYVSSRLSSDNSEQCSQSVSYSLPSSISDDEDWK